MERKKLTEMDKMVEALMEHVCDKLCQYPHRVDGQEELEQICADCKMGTFVCGILNKHSRYTGIVLCEECEYQAYEKSTDIHWCRTTEGLDVMRLRPGDGCSRGKRKAVFQEEGNV